MPDIFGAGETHKTRDLRTGLPGGVGGLPKLLIRWSKLPQFDGARQSRLSVDQMSRPS